MGRVTLQKRIGFESQEPSRDGGRDVHVMALCMEGPLERALGMLLREEGNKDRVWETPG